MKIVHSFKELGREIRRVPRLMGRARKEITEDIKDSFEVFANSYVPKQTTKLQRSIKATKEQDGWRISAGSFGRKGFRVGHFTNLKWAIDIKKPNPFFKTGQKFRYGQSGVVSVKGRPIKWSKPGQRKGWWTRAAEDTNKMYTAERVARRINTRIRT